MNRMIPSREQEEVLAAIAILCREDPAVTVFLSDVHHAFADMDVSTLVPCLGFLLDEGLIRNARPFAEKIGTMYNLTEKGRKHYRENLRKS